MKRLMALAVALAFALAFAPQADAQDSPMRLGLKGGAVTSSVGGDYYAVGDWKWGGIAGVVGEYHVARQTYVGLEAYWVQKGGKRVGFSVGSTQDLNVDYIQVPLTIGYVNRWGDWESSLYIGISISFQISCKLQPTGSSSSTDCEETIVPSKKTTDWSIPFGFAFMRNLGGSLLGLDIRYDWGLSDIFENTNVRNRSWQFALKWAVPMGG